jgi:hypothetical protein
MAVIIIAGTVVGIMAGIKDGHVIQLLFMVTALDGIITIMDGIHMATDITTLAIRIMETTITTITAITEVTEIEIGIEEIIITETTLVEPIQVATMAAHIPARSIDLEKQCERILQQEADKLKLNQEVQGKWKY